MNLTGPTNYLEPEYVDAFNSWKGDPSPANNASMLRTVQPILDGGINTYVGESNPIIQSSARQIALQGLRSYDPSRSRLQTHLYNHLQGLKRVYRKQTSPVHVPERITQDRYQLDQYTQELADELGRDPTDDELSNRTGFSPKRLARVRSYTPGVAEGTLDNIDPSLAGAASHPAAKAGQDAWLQIVYSELPTLDQQILEHTVGLNGRPKLSNMQIAKKLGRSPGAISQRKARIQGLLDQEMDLSPFLE